MTVYSISLSVHGAAMIGRSCNSFLILFLILSV